MEGTFEATLAVGAILAKSEQRRVRVYLTCVGAGAFGNATMWVEQAIARALCLFQACPLDVVLVHYGTRPANPRNKFIALEKKWPQQKGTKKRKQGETKDGSNSMHSSSSSYEVGGSDEDVDFVAAVVASVFTSKK